MGRPIPGGVCGGFCFLMVVIFGACCDLFSPSRRPTQRNTNEIINSNAYQSDVSYNVDASTFYE